MQMPSNMKYFKYNMSNYTFISSNMFSDIPERINCTTDHAQTIIVGAVFGIVSVVLSVYASYVTVLLRRIKRTQGKLLYIFLLATEEVNPADFCKGI
jgi:hypothetical protein